MQITFLEAPVPLVKSFSLNRGRIEKTSYPLTSKFSSHTYDITNIQQLYNLMIKHAELGHCLLKGEIQTDLIEQSRAGSTNPNIPTRWICLDADGIDVKTVETFLKWLPEPFSQTSYIIQYSASMGVIPNCGLRSHVMMLTDAPVLPSTLKQWLTRINLDVPKIRASLSLTRTFNAIKWPLDITVCQNDKLIYIAPPALYGITDQFKGPRIKLVKKRRSMVPLNLDNYNPGTLRKDTIDALNELRKAQGLPKKRSLGEKVVRGVAVTTASEQAEITGIKHDRGFTYLNLNGGDSWGYYHPENNVEVIYNFKGEPDYLTKELLPTYYAEQQQAQRTAPSVSVSDAPVNGWQYFAFIDRKSDNYYRGRWNEAEQKLEYQETGKRLHVIDYLKQHGQPLPDHLTLWDVEFDFHDSTRIDFDSRRLNLFVTTPYMDDDPAVGASMPPTINKIISHATGNDPASFLQFTNWLAAIMQYRIKTGIAWVLHGTQGTGKGVMFNHIITPLFGREQCTQTDVPTLATESFNGFLEQAVFCLIDEAQTTDLEKNRTRLMTQLRKYITEPYVPIRKMRTNVYQVKNFTNWLIFSNEAHSALIPAEDRRFSVAKRQPTPIELTVEEIEAIEDELPYFAAWLHRIDVDLKMAKTPMLSEDRELLQNLTRDTNEDVAHAVLTGNLEFFFENRPDIETPYELQQSSRSRLPTYREVFREIFTYPDRVSRNALQTLFYYTTNNSFYTPHRFTKFLAHKGLNTQVMRFGEQTIRGIPVQWIISSQLRREIKKWLKEDEKPQLTRVK